jgi:hypothetical protein
MNTGLIVVDVQPAYDKWCRSIAYQVAKRINNTRRPTVIVWVGEGYSNDTEEDVRAYLRQAGARPGKLDQCAFLEKTYGFFRGWMDNGVDDNTIIKVGAEMMRTQTRWSNGLDLAAVLGPDFDLDSLPEYDTLQLPHFDDSSLSGFNTFETCGGGRDECLAEFELYLEMQGKQVNRLPAELVY